MRNYDRDPDERHRPEAGEGGDQPYRPDASHIPPAFARPEGGGSVPEGFNRTPQEVEFPSDSEPDYLTDDEVMARPDLDANWETFKLRFESWPPPDAGVAYPSPSLGEVGSPPRAPAPSSGPGRRGAVPHIAPRVRRQPVPLWAWAAAAAVMSGGAYAGWQRHVQSAAPLVASAGMNVVYLGSDATIPVLQRLPDGTTFRLGRKSRLELDGTWEHDRTMRLVGDGYFDVTQDRRPFIVQTDRSVTRVLGTRFFVNAPQKEGAVRVGVLSGRVAVASEKNPLSMSVLDSGYVGRVGTNGKTTVAFDPNIAQNIGWVDGGFVMHDMAVPDVMAYLAERFNFRVATAPGTNLDHAYVRGVFPADYSLYECLKALKMTVGLRYVWYGDKLVVARLPHHALVHDKPVEWMPPDSIAIAPPARLAPPPDPTPELLRGGSARGGLVYVSAVPE